MSHEFLSIYEIGKTLDPNVYFISKLNKNENGLPREMFASLRTSLKFTPDYVIKLAAAASQNTAIYYVPSHTQRHTGVREAV